MPGGDAVADDDWQGRVADAWRLRFLLPAPTDDATGWVAADPWAFAESPDLRTTLERLQECAAAGAIGAAFDAIHVTEAHRRRFWKEAQKPIRPRSHALFDIAAALPEAPSWALECLGRHIAEGRNLKAHRRNIIHRLRALAVADLAEVREAHKEERFGTIDFPPSWKMLADTGVPEAKARLLAENDLRRFTSELLDERSYDRIREVLSDTPLIPAARQKQKAGESAPDGDALRASVRAVQKAFSQGWPGRFYLPSDRTLCALGMPDLAGMPAEIDRRIGSLFKRP